MTVMQSDVGALAEAFAGVSGTFFFVLRFVHAPAYSKPHYCFVSAWVAAGAVLASTLTYPLDIVKTRLIVDSAGAKPAQGILACIIDIAKYAFNICINWSVIFVHRVGHRLFLFLQQGWSIGSVSWP